MKIRNLFLVGFISAILISSFGTSQTLATEAHVTPVQIAQLSAQPMSSSLFGSSKKEDKSAKPVTVQRPAKNPAKQKPKPKHQLDPKYLPQMVSYSGSESPGTIVVDTSNRFLYLVEGNGQARRYGIGVGKQGFAWKGTQRVSRKAKWPTWTPPARMIERERLKGRILPAQMKGGINNPLGARALYLGSSLFRIHGTNQPWTIGTAKSSGCFRMRNEDVIDLYERVPVGTRVVVR